MKKRFLSVFLALALCLGLTVPAFADDSTTITLRISYPHYTTADKEVTRTYQTRSTIASSPDTVTYEEAKDECFSTLLLPLGVDFTVSLPSTCTVGFRVWQDEDGDGVYEHRALLESPDGSVSIAPFAESYTSTQEARYVSMSEAETFGFDMTRNEDGALKFPSDRLYEVFGADTILDIYWVEEDDGRLMTSLLLTGEEVPAPTVSFTDVDAGSWYIDPIAWAVDEKITQGAGNGKFSPDVDCPHIQILTFLWRAADKPDASAKCPVPVASYYQEAANWAYEKGLIDDSFDPDVPCTRADAVSYIWQALNKQKAARAASFSDVDADAPYAEAVSWAVEKGVTNGYGGKTNFAPNRVCNRGEIATFLYRAYYPFARLASK